MERGEIRSNIEGIARRLEEIGFHLSADNLRRASAKFYLDDDITMLKSTLETGQIILNRHDKKVYQEEEARVLRNTPDIEDFKPAEEIERLQNINRAACDLLIGAAAWLEKSDQPEIANGLRKWVSQNSITEGRDEG